MLFLGFAKKKKKRVLFKTFALTSFEELSGHVIGIKILSSLWANRNCQMICMNTLISSCALKKNLNILWCGK